MKTPALAASLAVFGLFVCGRGVVSAEPTKLDEEIRASAKNFAAAYNRADADAVAAHWTDDGEYQIGSNFVKGRSAIAALYQQFLAAHPGSKMDIQIASIRQLSLNTVIEQGTTSVKNSPHGPATASTYTAVHVKQADKWYLATVRDDESPYLVFDRDVKELAWLVGEWHTGKAATKVSWTCDWLADERFLRVEVAMHAPGGKQRHGTQIIGRNPLTGQVVSWFFNSDGSYGSGIWQQAASHWLIESRGLAADGTPTAAVNILYAASDDVCSWQSTQRMLGDTALPDLNEVVLERVALRK